jgi:hypothetical protein
MRPTRQICGVRVKAMLVALAALGLVLTAAPAVQADGFDNALAEVDAALESNPYGVPEDNLKTCRSMRKTAVLLKKMGHYERAFRRLKSCRKLLGIEDYRSDATPHRRQPWVA